ncbi:MAG: MoaD/ThiS family protein [Granulosicoccaceae bacterium]
MKIRLKTTGIMSDYLPDGAVGGQVELELPEQANFSVLVRTLAIPDEEQYVVSINDSLVPEPHDVRLCDGDRIIIMAPLAAG